MRGTPSRNLRVNTRGRLRPAWRLSCSAPGCSDVAPLNPIPVSQLPKIPAGKKLFGIVWHWTGGTHKANSLDVQHYQWIVNGDGTITPGVHPTRNFHPCPANYGAHTRNLNSGWLAISLSCLGGNGTNENNQGKWPMTKEQAGMMVAMSAQLARHYDIPVQRPSKTDPRGFISHAEVSEALGIWQAGKWDFTVCYDPQIRGAKNVGDFFRNQVRDLVGVSPVAALDTSAEVADAQQEPSATSADVGTLDNRQDKEPLSPFRWAVQGLNGITAGIGSLLAYLNGIKWQIVVSVGVLLLIYVLVTHFWPRPIVITKDKQ